MLSCKCTCVYVQTIVAWSGSKANMFERQKVREIAMLIRDTERNGKAHIIDVTEGEEPLEMVQVTNTKDHIIRNPFEFKIRFSFTFWII